MLNLVLLLPPSVWLDLSTSRRVPSALLDDDHPTGRTGVAKSERSKPTNSSALAANVSLVPPTSDEIVRLSSAPPPLLLVVDARFCRFLALATPFLAVVYHPNKLWETGALTFGQ